MKLAGFDFGMKSNQIDSIAIVVPFFPRMLFAFPIIIKFSIFCDFALYAYHILG